MHKTILIALLLPTLVMAEQTASQTAYLQYRACLLSATQPSAAQPSANNTDNSTAALAMARSKCATQRAKLSADIIAELRSEGRPESLARRIAEDAVRKLESGLQDDLARPADGTR